jgi:hypothetical protein
MPGESLTSPDSRNGAPTAQHQCIALRDLDLVIFASRPDHSDVGDAAPGADQGHRLQSCEFRWLRDAGLFMQVVIVAKQLLDYALSQVHVALGHRNRNSRRRWGLLASPRLPFPASSSPSSRSLGSL